jgi:hypothetical protein
MALREIARFVEPEDAALAAEFLTKWGITAFAPQTPYSRSIGAYASGALGDTPVLVEDAKAEEARHLLRRVQAGEFSVFGDEGETRNGLGAALARAIAADPSYRRPPAWILWSPLGAILLLLVVWFLLTSLPHE